MLNDKKAKLLRSIHDRLFEHYGVLGCPLLHNNAFQLLIAVLLSAQCKDDRVNMVTPELFEKYPTPEAMSKASVPAPEASGHSPKIHGRSAYADDPHTAWA